MRGRGCRGRGKGDARGGRCRGGGSIRRRNEGGMQGEGEGGYISLSF